METGQILEWIIDVTSFLVASYFLFYRSWLKALGREVAKLSTIGQLTQLKEEVKSDFNEKLEAYKNKLSEELSAKIEPLKSELAKNNISYQIEYSFLHQERAKATLEIYRKLQELNSAMMDWTATIHPIVEDGNKEDEQRLTRANIATTNFRNYYIQNKVFFSDSFCEYIDETFQEYWSKGWDFGYKQERLKNGGLSKEYATMYSDDLYKISKEIRENFPKKIREIETRCRKILRVEEELK